MGPDKEQAYRILGLEPGASFREVMEAHRDLVAVWDPRRFQGNPRLEKKAARELEAINAAFEKLRAHHRPHETIAPPSEEPIESPPPETLQRTSEKRDVRRPSLYEDAFSDRGRAKSSRRIPWWAAVIPASLILFLVLYLVSTPSSESPPPPVADQTPAFSKTSELLEQLRETGDESGPVEEAVAEGEAPTAEPESEAKRPDAPSSPGGEEVEPGPPRSSQAASQSPSQDTSATPTAPPEPPPAAAPAARQPATAVTPGDNAGSNEGQGAEDEPEATEEGQPDLGGALAEEAYQKLVQASDRVSDLVQAGRWNDLEYRRWRAVRVKLPEIWIDIVAEKASSEVHLIWAVNLDSGSVQPLSQAARDMASYTTGPKPRLDRSP